MCFAPLDQFLGQPLHISLELEGSTHHFGLRFCQLLTELIDPHLHLFLLLSDIYGDVRTVVDLL